MPSSRESHVGSWVDLILITNFSTAAFRPRLHRVLRGPTSPPPPLGLLATSRPSRYLPAFSLPPDLRTSTPPNLHTSTQLHSSTPLDLLAASTRPDLQTSKPPDLHTSRPPNLHTSTRLDLQISRPSEDLLAASRRPDLHTSEPPHLHTRRPDVHTPRPSGYL